MFYRLVVLCLGLLVMPVLATASELNIRPFLIDKTLVPRESTTEVIKIDNEYEFRKAIVFATVNEITVGADGEVKEFVTPVMTDRTNTVTSWIEIGRGRIEILPGEAVEVPLTISVHPYAEPGEYHVFIGLVEAKKRHDAEQIALAGDAPGVVVKVTVADERVDSMRVASLAVDRFIIDPDSQTLAVTVENPGELTSAPAGELIFYNSRGVEIAAVEVNQAQETIAPGNTKTFAVPVPFDNDVGRYKANLNLHYGANQQAALYDTTSFFMIPIWYLVALCVGLLGLVALFTVAFKRTLATTAADEHGEEVAMFVRDGHEPNPQDHDIDLSTKS